MGTFSIWHWVIVLIVVILVFGTAKIKNIGKDLGAAIKDFKKGLKEDETESPNTIEASATESVVEESKEKNSS